MQTKPPTSWISPPRTKRAANLGTPKSVGGPPGSDFAGDTAAVGPAMHGLHAKVNNMAAILKQWVFIVAAAIAKALFVWSLDDASKL
jgi:hypothetical protein